MFIIQTLKKLYKKIDSLPKRLTIPVGVTLILTIMYSLLFFLDKPITFSYAGSTCINQLTIFPDIVKTSNESAYKVHTGNELRIANFSLAAFSICFSAQTPPKEGISKVSTAPFSGFFARTTYAITVPHPVNTYIHEIKDPIPGSKPLEIRLDGRDKVFSYVLSSNNKHAQCKSIDAKLSCAIGDLGLTQGKTYNIDLLRQFKGKTTNTVASKSIAILSATKVVATSVKPSEIVYSKPREIDLTFDKNVKQVAAVLYRKEKDNWVRVETSTTFSGAKLNLKTTTDLLRLAEYKVSIDKLEAEDGSGLDAPYVLPFQTSGGPKVVSTNIGATSVTIGSTVVITFDQQLLASQDVTAFLQLSSGVSFISKKDNQIVLSLAGVPKCGDFTIKLTNDIQSNFEINGSSAWSFASRTICHTVSTIGYSTNGRPINAYYFGSGSRTVVYTGAIHGNEFSSKLLMERWIQDLESKARSIPSDKTIIVIPSLNPDGVSAGIRTNARNVDLNRNFDTSDWQKDVTDTNNNPFPGGGGSTPMSERETQVLASFVRRVQPVLIMSYHSQGNLIAANQAGNSNSLVQSYAAMSGYRNITGQSSTVFQYGISGTADDWYAEKLNIPSILIELGSHTNPQFDRNQKAMWAMVNV
ncbi:MAG: M14 family metallopeptidase [Candidatus Saccharimonadales bacterium]